MKSWYLYPFFKVWSILLYISLQTLQKGVQLVSSVTRTGGYILSISETFLSLKQTYISSSSIDVLNGTKSTNYHKQKALNSESQRIGHPQAHNTRQT